MIVQDFDFDAASLKALEKATLMVRNGLYSRFHLSVQQRIEKAYLGCLGELAFESYLQSQSITYQLDPTDFKVTNTDAFDFLISEKKIDIKVAKKTTPNNPSDEWTYGYPQSQQPETKDYIVVGWVGLAKKEVGFYGWITGKEVSTLPVVSKNAFAGYGYRTPNHEFKWGLLEKDFTKLFRLIGAIS